MTIDSISNGYVLDHIKAGMGVKIYKILNLQNFEGQIALIQNAKSTKMGKKDVLKIATNDFSLDLDAVAYLSPETTVNVIKDSKAVEKKELHLPSRLVNIVHCENPRCITNHEKIDDEFVLVDEKNATYRCLYCETAAKN